MAPNRGACENDIEGRGGEQRKNQKWKREWGNRKSQQRWRLWLRGWLQISTEGFPGSCLQWADHTLRGWRREQEDKDLASLSFPLNPLFSLPVCLRLSLKGLRLTCWPILNFPARARLLLHLSSSSPLIHLFTPLSSLLPVIFPHRNLGFTFLVPFNTTAQTCSVSFCIFYLPCRDKPGFITLSDLLSKSVRHRHTCATFHIFLFIYFPRWMPSHQPEK